MKHASLVFLSLMALGLFVSCNNDGSQVSGDVVHNPITASGEGDMNDLPIMTFDETLHDFGTVIEGETVTYNFKFTNTGKIDLIIASVSATCGCTATKYTREPIAPGKTGVITVTFDSRRRGGFQNKTITVAANTQPSKTILRIKAQVVSPKDL
jgi:hypothetical protein